MIKLATEMNIQVFVNTNRPDCIRSFLKAAKNDKDVARLIRLESRNDKEVAIIYDDPDEFEYISKNDIETR